MATAQEPETEPERAWLEAADSADLTALQRLLTTHPQLLNARVYHETFKSTTALHLSAWKNRSALTAFLMDQGADIELQNQTGMTALQVDVLRTCLQKMRPMPLLRSRWVDVESPVALAIFNRKLVRDRSTYRDIDTSVLDLLLTHKASVNNRSEGGDTALLMAVEYGLIKHVEKLVAAGADVYVKDQNGRTVLDIAGEHGFVDVISVLVQNYPDLVAIHGETTLIMAVRHEFVGVLEVLYDRVLQGISPDDVLALGGRLLHIAVEYDAPTCAQFLLDRGILLDWTNGQHESAVHIACSCGRPQMLELLLDRSPATEAESEPWAQLPNDVVMLRHRYVEMEVLERFEDSLSFVGGTHHLPTFFGMEVVEVLVRHGATFEFPSSFSRDAIAPLLAAWLQRVAPAEVPKVLQNLMNSGCIRHKLCHVVVALMWSEHTYEALLLVLLMLFSTRKASAQQALAIVEPWLLMSNANIVTRKLLTDAMRT